MLLVIGLALAVALGTLLLAVGPATGAATLPAGFTESQVATGLQDPTTMAFAPDGRLFVAEQAGKLRIIDNNDTRLSTPAVDLSGKIDSTSERGLLGVAFDRISPTNITFISTTR